MAFKANVCVADRGVLLKNGVITIPKLSYHTMKPGPVFKIEITLFNPFLFSGRRNKVR